jgi:hypothetical protein
MSTLAVVEAILRDAAIPLSVREIVERAGDALPTKSKTPDTVVARDLSMDIKKKSDGSTFVRTSPGRYAIREQTPVMQTSDSAPSIAVASESVTAPVVPLSVATPVTPPAVAAMGGAPSIPPVLADAATPLVGQSLPHDRNGARPAPAKPQSNSEDTPMSA